MMKLSINHSKFLNNILPRLTTIKISSFSTSSVQPSSVDYESDSDINWDGLGFHLVPTDYMYTMKSSIDGHFTDGKLDPYGNIQLSPCAGVLNYGQGLIEGLKAYRKHDGHGYLLFRPKENALRMQYGAERMCMPSPTVQQFIDAMKQTVAANKRWVPPNDKGALYLRPLLLGTGPILGVAPSPEYTFLVYASPAGKYFKQGSKPIDFLIRDDKHRTTPGGSGSVKTIANYAPIMKTLMQAKSQGFTDVLYLDSKEKRYIEEGTACNIFVLKNDIISTPCISQGTILDGVTRKSIIEIARDCGYKVEERLVSTDDIMGADEVFVTGTAVSVVPVGSVTFHGRRVEYRHGEGTAAQRLSKCIADVQTGAVEDIKGWTVEI